VPLVAERHVSCQLISYRSVTLNELDHTAPQVGISNRLARVVVGRENALGTMLTMMARKAVLYLMMKAVLVSSM
jgi:hypothetical protein